MRKKIKKFLSLVLAVSMLFGLMSTPMQAQAADADTYVKQMISYYRDYQDAAATDIERVVSELKQVDQKTGEAWEKIMNYWSDVNQDGAVNIDTVPDGIPAGNNVAIVILGFALNADGTMKEELVGRLQTGLNIANQYTNAYVVVTGGGTAANNPNVTEGGLMGEWLLEQGLDEARLIIENRAPSTVGNAQYTYEILKTEYPQVDSVVLVTSDYHVPRGCAIYYSKFVLDALATGQEPLEIVSNAGFGTGSNGYESYSLQASGVCQVAGISASSLPTMELSVLETLTASVDEELKLTAVAKYDSGYERDVTDLLVVEGFDAEAGADQNVFVSYEENGLAAKGYFALNSKEKVFTTNYSKVENLLADADEVIEAVYTEETVEILQIAAAYAEEVLADAEATEEDFVTAAATLTNALDALEMRENIALKKPVTASHNVANAKKITDGNHSNYWEGIENGVNIPVNETSLIIDLQGIYAIDALTAIPYYAGEERYYHYDISVSTDNETWTTVAEQRSEEDTQAAGATFVLEEAVDARYVKIAGVATKVVGRDDITNFHLNEVLVYGDFVEEVEIEEEPKAATNLALYGKVTGNEGALKLDLVTDGKSTENAYYDSALDDPKDSYVVIELPGTSVVEEVRVVTYSKNTEKWYSWEVLASEDNETWTSIAKYEEQVNPGYDGVTLKLEAPATAKYLKIQGLDTNNKGLHLVEVEAWGTMDDIAEGKATTVNKFTGTNGASAVDGALNTYWSSDTTWAEATEEDLPCMVLDLDGIYELDNVNVLNYRSSSRYYQYEIYTSMDGEEYTLLAEKKDQVNSQQSINYVPAEGTTARFIKFVGTLNSANSGFHLNALRITGTLVNEEDADYSAVEAALDKIPEDLSVYTVASVVDLKIAVAGVEEGLKASDQKKVDAMAAAIEAAITALVELPTEEPDVPEEPTVDITTGMIAYYNFDQVAADAASVENIVDAATYEATLLGGTFTEENAKYGQALKLAGGDANGLSIQNIMNTGTGSYSISMWYKQDAANKMILAQQDGVRRTLLLVYPDGHYTTNVNNAEFGGTSTRTGTEWQHVTWVYDVDVENNSSSVTFYANGEFDATVDSKSESNWNVLTNLLIGRHKNPGGTSFVGLLDEIRIYEGAVTAEQAKAIYEYSVEEVPEVPVDKTVLNEAIEEAEALVAEDYVDFTAVAEALEAAQKVAAKEDATQEEVDAALAVLNEAVEALEEKEVIEIPKTEVCKIFVDVEHGAWYEGSVQYVYDEEIIVGDGNVFAPEDATTRAMVAMILYRLAGSPKVTDYMLYNQFTDLPAVEECYWYTDAVAWALNTGVSTGDDYNMLYNPTASVTREQLALFLYRYAAYTGEDVTVTAAYDELFGGTYVDDWAKEGFAWAIENGIIKGAETTDDAGNMYYDLNPQGGATRAQFARVLHRYLGGATE